MIHRRFAVQVLRRPQGHTYPQWRTLARFAVFHVAKAQAESLEGARVLDLLTLKTHHPHPSEEVRP